MPVIRRDRFFETAGHDAHHHIELVLSMGTQRPATWDVIKDLELGADDEMNALVVKFLDDAADIIMRRAHGYPVLPEAEPVQPPSPPWTDDDIKF